MRGTPWVQMSLPYIRFPERIPVAPEHITDGVTGRHQPRHRRYHEGRVSEAAAGLLPTKAPLVGSLPTRPAQPRRWPWRQAERCDHPGTVSRLGGVGDPGEKPAQFDRRGKLPALVEGRADCRGLGFGDAEHRRSMRHRAGRRDPKPPPVAPW
jgi:hypothetical protein